MVRLSLEQVRERIAAADNVAALRTIREQAHETYRDPLLFADFDEYYTELNFVHDALIARSVELAAAYLEERGMRAPALPYAFLLFGSGGRGEQTLWSDQDNGLVYANPRDEQETEQAAAYFVELAAEIHRFLLALGYPPCTGEVLAVNPMWRRPYREYASMVQGWMEEPSWENIRYLLVFSDARCIYGNCGLAEKLRCVLLDYVRDHPSVLQAMLQNTLHHKVPIGLLGQLITERYGEAAGGIDVKYGVYIPVINGIRLLAIKGEIMVTSTTERLDVLEVKGHLPRELAADFRRMTATALKLRAMTPFRLEAGLYTTSGKLPAEVLTKLRRDELKLALRLARKLQRFVKQAIGGGGM
jgi:CBS domain-containing protein